MKNNRKEKLAFVVDRYGTEVNGGAEDACRLLAEHFTDQYDVTVFTSMSKGINPWDNELKSRSEIINNVTVYRFPVEKKEESRKDVLESAGPYCPSLIETVKRTYKKYKAVFFETYGYYTTNKGIETGIPNSIIIPTAHDIASTREHRYGDAISLAKGILFNSIEEKELIETYYHIDGIPSRITCFAIDKEKYDEVKMAKEGNYIIYAGRVSDNKNFRELNRFFLEYKRRNPSDLKLVVLGRIDNHMEIICHNDIVFKGFVSEEEKIQFIKGAKALVLPSKNESLSIVLLESWICRIPVIVNGGCPVLKGQCVRSNAGLYYTDYLQFEKELQLIEDNRWLFKRMGENGREYVLAGYSWDKVIKNIDSLIHEISQTGGGIGG